MQRLMKKASVVLRKFNDFERPRYKIYDAKPELLKKVEIIKSGYYVSWLAENLLALYWKNIWNKFQKPANLKIKGCDYATN